MITQPPAYLLNAQSPRAFLGGRFFILSADLRMLILNKNRGILRLEPGGQYAGERLYSINSWSIRRIRSDGDIILKRPTRKRRRDSRESPALVFLFTHQ